MTEQGRDPRIPDPEQTAWQQSITSRLDASTRDLDAATLSRLNRARQLALGQLPQRHPRLPWLMAGAATAALSLVLVLRPPSDAGAPALPATPLVTEDFELLSSEDAALASDIEFYAWLAAQERGG
ncbi:MAG: DUF3619 family protein [Lysobacterales bacterium]